MNFETEQFPKEENPDTLLKHQEMLGVLAGLDKQKIQREAESIAPLSKNFDEQGNLIAPNNKQSHLSKLEWKMARTESFKDIFGDWEAIANREIFQTTDILKDIISHTSQENLKEVASLLMSNEKIINNSTILRGNTYDGKGIGQALLRGSVENPTPQVYVVKGFNDSMNTSSKNKFVPFEEMHGTETLNQTILHELLHSFTRYIVATHEQKKEKRLTEQERIFYTSVSALHKRFLEKNKTGDAYLDGLDEYIAKAMTSDFPENGHFDQEQYQLVFKEFKKLYDQMKNLRSLSTTVSSLVDENSEPLKELMRQITLSDAHM